MSFGGNNDSFGCIAPQQGDNSVQMDIDDNDEIINNDEGIDQLHYQGVDYEKMLIDRKVNDSLENLCKVIMMRHSRFSLKTLLTLPYKNCQSISQYEVYKSTIILQKIQRSMNALIAHYHNKQRVLLHGRFRQWKRRSYVMMIYDKTKGSIESNMVKNNNTKRLEAEKLVGMKQKEITKIKEKINGLNDNINQWTKSIKASEEKEGEYMKSINELQEDNKVKEEDMRKRGGKTMNCLSNGNDDGATGGGGGNSKKSRLEAKISELEQTVKTLEDDLKEKDNDISVFVKDINEMLDYYEQKANEHDARNVSANTINRINMITATAIAHTNTNTNTAKDPRHKWKSPTNPRTSTFKNSFNALPNPSTSTSTNNPNPTPIQTQSQKRPINPTQSINSSITVISKPSTTTSTGTNKQHSTITTKPPTTTSNLPSSIPPTNTSNTTRGIFLHISTNLK